MGLFTRKDAEFTADYTAYYTLVFTMILKVIRDFSQAEDLVHEVFIRYYNTMDSAESRRRWLIGITRHIISNYRRLQIPEPVPPDIGAIEDLTPPYHDPSPDLRIIIENAIDSIQKEFDRIVFELISLEGYTHEQAGRALNCPRRRIKYRYQIAHRQVLEHLRRQGVTGVLDLV